MQTIILAFAHSLRGEQKANQVMCLSLVSQRGEKVAKQYGKKKIAKPYETIYSDEYDTMSVPLNEKVATILDYEYEKMHILDTRIFPGMEKSDYDIISTWVKIMREAKMPEEYIYAVAKTGRILTADNVKFVHEEDEKEWYEAVEEYHNKKNKEGMVEEALNNQSKDKLPIFSTNDLEKIFDSRNYHELIVEKCKKTYVNNHMKESVISGIMAVLNEIKRRTGRVDLDGNELIDLVFSTESPMLEVYSYNRGDKTEQQGVHFLFKGFIYAIRNQFLHREIYLGNPFTALEYLSFLNFLLIILDNMYLNDELSDKKIYQKGSGRDGVSDTKD